MASPELNAVWVVLALAAVACNDRSEPPPQASVTVKLPPARPPASAPAFSFQAREKASAAKDH